MIKLNEKQYNLIKPIVENLDEYLKNDKAENIVDEIAFHFCDLKEPYPPDEIEREKVMDYIHSTYCVKSH